MKAFAFLQCEHESSTYAFTLMKPVEAAAKYPSIEVFCLVAPGDKQETVLPVARTSFKEAAVPDSSTTV